MVKVVGHLAGLDILGGELIARRRLELEDEASEAAADEAAGGFKDETAPLCFSQDYKNARGG